MMLTKTQKRILYKTIEISNNGHAVVSWYDVSVALKIHPDDVMKAMKVLVSKELLEYTYQPGTKLPAGVILTSYSMNLKEYNWLQFKEFLVSNLIAILALMLSAFSIGLSLAGYNDKVQNTYTKNVYLESAPTASPNEVVSTQPENYGSDN